MTIPQGATRRKAKGGLEASYRAQLSAVIELERLMVQLGYMRPEERRVMSREERRQHIDNKPLAVVE